MLIGLLDFLSHFWEIHLPRVCTWWVSKGTVWIQWGMGRWQEAALKTMIRNTELTPNRKIFDLEQEILGQCSHSPKQFSTVLAFTGHKPNSEYLLLLLKTRLVHRIPHSSSQLPVMPVPGVQFSLLTSMGSRHTCDTIYIYAGNKLMQYSYNIIIKNNNLVWLKSCIKADLYTQNFNMDFFFYREFSNVPI